MVRRGRRHVEPEDAASRYRVMLIGETIRLVAL